MKLSVDSHIPCESFGINTTIRSDWRIHEEVGKTCSFYGIGNNP